MQLFGTDGIRAEAGTFPLDQATIPLIGHAIGEHLGGRILVGRDGRESGPEILGLLEAGILESGATIEDAGVLPTPAIALLTRDHSDLSGGIVISASHNPFKDNGIKVFGPDGRKLEAAAETALESRVAELGLHGARSGRSLASNPRRDRANPGWLERYLELLASGFPKRNWLKNRHLTLDCGNGAMSHVAPEFLTSLGATITAIHANPTGTNINVECGAVHPESLIEAVRKNGSDLGVAYDGDGDRSIFVSSTGRILDGDAILLVLARSLKRAGKLEPAVVVGTSMTNYNLERMLAEEGVKVVRVGVGDRYVFGEMLTGGAPLGGEPSGHVIFSDHRLSGDGLLTTLKILETMVSEQASLDGLTEDWMPAPQMLRNVRVEARVPLEDFPTVVAEIDQITRKLEGRGRIVVRYSGTEPLLRIMVESDSDNLNQECVSSLIGVVRKALGAAT